MRNMKIWRPTLLLAVLMAVTIFTSVGANKVLAFEDIPLHCDDPNDMQVMISQIPANTQGIARSFGVNADEGQVIEWTGRSNICVTEEGFCTGFAESIRAEDALPVGKSNRWTGAQISSAPIDLAAFKRLDIGPVSIRLTWCTDFNVFPDPQIFEQPGGIEVFQNDLGGIPLQSDMPDWMQGIIRLASWVDAHPNAAPEDVPFTPEDKVALEPIYRLLHPEEYPAQLNVGLRVDPIDGKAGFTVWASRPLGGMASS